MTVGAIVAKIQADVSHFKAGMLKVKELSKDAGKNLKENFSKKLTEAKELMNEFGEKAKTATTLVVGGLIAVAGGIGKLAIDASKLGKIQETFERLARAVDIDNVHAMQRLREETRGLMSDQELMESSNKLLAMGLATSEDALVDITSKAVTLGNVMGVDAKESIENFTLMMANQSVLRLDTFGISSAKVRTRIEELMESTKGMTREEAFYIATMEEADKTLEKLGDQNLTLSERVQQAKVDFINWKDEMAQRLIPIVENVWDKLGELWRRIKDELTPKVLELRDSIVELAKKIKEKLPNWDEFSDKIVTALGNVVDFAKACIDFVNEHPKISAGLGIIAGAFILVAIAVSMTPIGLLSTLLAISVGLIALNWDDFIAVWDWWKNTIGGINGAFEIFVNNVSALYGWLAKILDKVPGMWGFVKAMEALNAITGGASFDAPTPSNKGNTYTPTSPISTFTPNTSLGMSTAFPQNANGTDFWKGGWTRINERGKEFINLPRGSQIIPNEALGGATINIDLSGAKISSEQDALEYSEIIGNGIINSLALHRRTYG